VTLDDREREQILEKLEHGAEEIKQGLEMKDPSLVSHIFLDENYRNRFTGNWMCNRCVYKKRCFEFMK
jgi:hypothetical protein